MFDLSGQSKVKKKDKQSFSPFPEFSPSLGVGPRIDLLPRLRAQQQATPYQAPQPELNPIVGENLFLNNAFPIRQNDNPLLKGIKGIGNFGISTLSAPGELLRKVVLEGGSLLTGNGLKELPKNTSFTQDILPKSASSAINSFSQNHPVLGGIANMAIETAADPTAYLSGKAITNFMKPSEIGMLRPNIQFPKRTAPSQEWTPPGQIRPVQRSTELGPLQLNRNDHRVKLDELTNTFNNAPIGSVDTPITRSTLQGNIDSRLGIGKPTEGYQGLDAFPGPLKSYVKSNDIQNSVAEITKKMTNQANDVTKTLRQMDSQTPVETVRSQIQKMGGIKQGNSNIFEEQKDIPNWIRNDRTGRPLDEVANTLGMDSNELLATISSEGFKPKDYASEAFKVLAKDPEYQALSGTLDTLKGQLLGKKTFGSLKKPSITDGKNGILNQGDNMPIVKITSNDEFIPIELSKSQPVEAQVYRGKSASDSGYSGVSRYGEGTYYSNSPKVADIFAKNRGEGSSVEKSTVRLEKPFVNESLDATSQEYKNLSGLLKQEGLTEYHVNKILSGEGVAPFDAISELFTKGDKAKMWAGSNKASELIKESGYDGIIGNNRNLPDMPNHIEIVKFGDKTQFAPKNESQMPITKSDIKLKPRELTPKAEPLPIQPAQRMVLSGNLPVDAPGRPIRQLTPISKDAPNIGNAPLKTPNPTPIDTKKFWASVTKELHSIGQFPPITTELVKKQIKEGKIDISKLSNEEEIRRMLGMDLQKFSENTTPPRVIGAESIIPAGLKERGVSENIRTDLNRPDALRDSYSVDPLVYKQLGNKETLAKAQSIFDQGLEPAITQLDSLVKDLKPESAPLVKMIADKLTVEGNIVRARELLSNAANKATESGQFGQAFRILRDADPETFLMTFDKQLNKLNKEGLDQYGKNWKTVDLTPDELAMVSKIERGNQASYDSAFEQIQARIANEMPASAMEKINAWRHISMLLNPKTQIRNVGGNAIMMGMRKSAQSISGILQKVLPQADRTQSVLVNKEYKQLAGDYFEINKKDLLGGANKYQEGISLNMPNKRVFQNNALEKTRRFTYDLLQKGDNPFFQNAYINRLASYAQAKGIKDLSKLDQVAFDTAKKEAEQATYKDASVIAEFVNKVKRTDKNSSIGRKAGAVLTEAALPFTKTPINIIKRGIQYSPIGIANGLAGIKSSKGAAVAIDEIAKGLTGTGILGLGYLLASKGILTGKASSDPDLKAYDTNTGNSPFSVLGKFSYDWMQPFSVPLSVGVEIYNAIKDNPKDTAKMNSVIASNDTSKFGQMALTAANGIMEGLNASGDTVFNMSIMKGIKTLLGSGYNGFMEGMAQLPQNYATQFIPTLSSQIAGTIDPLVRSAYVPGNLPASFKNTLISKIPIASKTLQPKQTPYGEDMKKIENPLGRAFSQFLSPGIIAKDQGNVSPKIDTELRRLNESGLANQFPTMVPNYIEKTLAHPKISLSPAEATQYQQRVGQLTLSSFGKVMSSDSYLKTNDDTKKADLLAKAISDAKALVKEEILKNKGIATAKAKVYSPFAKSTNKSSADSPFASQKKDKNSTSPFK